MTIAISRIESICAVCRCCLFAFYRCFLTTEKNDSYYWRNSMPTIIIQISSMLIDTLSDFYAPITQFQNGIFYADSYFSSIFSFWTIAVRIVEKVAMTEWVFSGHCDCSIRWNRTRLFHLCLLSTRSTLVLWCYWWTVCIRPSCHLIIFSISTAGKGLFCTPRCIL